MMAQSQGSAADKIELKDISVYRVQGKKAYKYVDKDKKSKETKTAYLVIFKFDAKPPVTNTVVKYYIGDYAIPEYGGTSDGIYFRILDPTLLSKLDKQEISYRIATSEKVSLKKQFIMPDTKGMKVEEEEAVWKRLKH
jgi:hypothetical protein